MKVSQSEFTHQGNLSGHKVNMTVDALSMAHIMNRLTDLYSDPELAVLREYSTNAWDSHVEANVQRPIEVTTPNSFNKSLCIKDYGVGMSLDDIENVYSKYGASTKRNTNSQSGMLGFGCKSALTYTNQFTVKSVKDGVKINVVVYRQQDGTGTMEVVSQKPTDECNGVEIIIPTKADSAFLSKAENFFRFWPEGSVLLNGAFLKEYQHIKVTDNILVYPDLRKNYVVMGGVSYPINSAHDTIIDGGRYITVSGIVYYVDIGEVDFTPSRENLHYTGKTEALIKAKQKEFISNICKAIEDLVDSAPNKQEAVNKYKMYRSMNGLNLLVSDIKYRGEKIEYEFNFSSRYYVSQNEFAQRECYVSALTSGFGNSCIMKGFDKKRLYSPYRQKIAKYLEENNIVSNVVYICDVIPHEEWLPEYVKVIDFVDVQQIELPKVARAKSTKKVKQYDALLKDGRKTVIDKLPAGELVYISPGEITEMRNSYSQEYVDTIINLLDLDTIILLTRNRFEKFCAENKRAKHYQEVLKERIQGYVDSLTEDDIKEMISSQSWWRYDFNKLDPEKIDDPELAAAIRIHRNRNVYEKKYNQYIYMQNMSRRFQFDIKFPTVETNDYGPFDKYPIVKYINSYYKSEELLLEHIYTYINHIYKENNAVYTVQQG